MMILQEELKLPPLEKQRSSLTAVIPPKKGAICPGVRDKERYKTRAAIERFFGIIKENKRLTLRFDKQDVTCFSFLL